MSSLINVLPSTRVPFAFPILPIGIGTAAHVHNFEIKRKTLCVQFVPAFHTFQLVSRRDLLTGNMISPRTHFRIFTVGEFISRAHASSVPRVTNAIDDTRKGRIQRTRCAMKRSHCCIAMFLFVFRGKG